MKKLHILLVCGIMLSSLLASSQIKKGSIFLGGDISGSTRKTKIDGVSAGKDNGIRISPVFGKAIKDNLFFGFDATVDFRKSDFNSSPYDYKQQAYGGGLFLRKYKELGKSDFFLFMQGRLGYEYNFNHSDYSSPINSKRTLHSIGISAYPGISYAVNKKLHLETGFNGLLDLRYTNEKREDRNGSIVSTTQTNGLGVFSSLNNLSNIYVGFRLLLSK